MRSTKLHVIYLLTYLLVLKYWNTGHSLHVIVVVHVPYFHYNNPPRRSISTRSHTSYIGNRDRNFLAVSNCG